MNPTQGVGPVVHSEIQKSSKEIKQDTTAPSKTSLPRALSTRIDAAKNDLALSFGMIGEILKSPFIFLTKAENKIELAENVFWGLVLPATLPAVLLGAAMMVPISLISGIVSFVMADTTQNIASGVYDPNPIQHYEDPNPSTEIDEISTTDPLNYNPINPEETKKP